MGLIQMDVCGQMEVESLGGAKYFASFVDYETRYSEVRSLESKSEFVGKVTEIVAFWESHTATIPGERTVLPFAMRTS
jgi:hypothetical protein